MNKKTFNNIGAFAILVIALIGVVPAASAGVSVTGISDYQISPDYSISGSISTEYDVDVPIGTEVFITANVKDGFIPDTPEEAEAVAHDMLKYAQHYPECQKFLEHWNKEELRDEIIRQVQLWGYAPIQVSSEWSDREEVVYGTYENEIKFYYDDSGAVKYFISSDNNPQGSVILQDWNPEYFAENGYDQAREDAIQYGLDHNTPISEERTPREMKRELKVHNKLYEWTKDPGSTFYALLQRAGKDPMAVEFRTGEMNIDKEPETFYGSSWMPIEWQEQLGLTSKEFQVAQGILSEID